MFVIIKSSLPFKRGIVNALREDMLQSLETGMQMMRLVDSRWPESLDREHHCLKSEWINRALPVAINVKHNWGGPIAVTIAQRVLESNWGRKAKGNAYFCVKGKSPKGKSVAFATHENYDGKSVKINDSFRSYDSLEQSADDYGRFLSVNKRYATAFSYPNDPEKFIHVIASTGYATDPDYEKKLLNIIRGAGLKDYDVVNISISMCYISPLHYFYLLG